MNQNYHLPPFQGEQCNCQFCDNGDDYGIYTEDSAVRSTRSDYVIFTEDFYYDATLVTTDNSD